MKAQNQRALGVAEAQVARAELYDTLGQLSERLNYAKRVDEATARFGAQVREVRRERPLVFAAGVVVVAAAAGTVVWAIARRVARGRS